MSAKGRGRHEGGEFDFYPTPPWCVHRLLEDCGHGLFPDGGTYALEPTCGDGAIVRAVNEVQSDVSWVAVELRRNAWRGDKPASMVHVEGVDFRRYATPIPRPAKLVRTAIGNPPYNLAEEIIRASMGVAHIVAMLLRVGFLGSDERVDFFRGVGANPALRILPDRPSFDGVGTDASTYAWFVWGHPQITGVKMLGSTPLAVRKAQTPQGLAFEAKQGSLLLGETGT